MKRCVLLALLVLAVGGYKNPPPMTIPETNFIVIHLTTIDCWPLIAGRSVVSDSGSKALSLGGEAHDIAIRL